MNNVANTIRDQIGHGAFMMLGAKNLLATDDALHFQIRGSRKANRVVVRLAASDTYTVEFFKVRALKCVKVASVSDVYFDKLRAVIESHTGLYTSL